MFSLLDFSDEKTCEVVPTNWLTDENRKTYYPPYKEPDFGKQLRPMKHQNQLGKYVLVESCIKQVISISPRLLFNSIFNFDFVMYARSKSLLSYERFIFILDQLLLFRYLRQS